MKNKQPNKLKQVSDKAVKPTSSKKVVPKKRFIKKKSIVKKKSNKSTQKGNQKKVTQELSLEKKNKWNKIFIGLFLLIAVGGLVMKIIEGILLDFGYGVNEMIGKPEDGLFHPNFWTDADIVAKANKLIPGAVWTEKWANPALHQTVARHPNTFWLLTQFTWITTIVVIVFLVIRFFRFEPTIPSWLRNIMSQRTLSLITMYDTIVAVGFWGAMFKTFQDGYVDGLVGFETAITIIVHGVIPFLLLCYSLYFLLTDTRASAVKEMFVLKGILYPALYITYYILISAIWNDPYGVSDLHNDFSKHIWKLPVALILLWIALGIMLLIHNLLLIKFNKKYNPKYDFEVISRRNAKIEKIRRKVTRKVINQELKKQQ